MCAARRHTCPDMPGVAAREGAERFSERSSTVKLPSGLLVIPESKPRTFFVGLSAIARAAPAAGEQATPIGERAGRVAGRRRIAARGVHLHRLPRFRHEPAGVR